MPEIIIGAVFAGLVVLAAVVGKRKYDKTIRKHYDEYKQNDTTDHKE